MRALAHPVRMALLDLFDVRHTLTATQASEVLGESPANCAFHLRTLAKYGFVREAGGGRGRERPWTVVHRSLSLSSGNLETQQARQAATVLEQVFLDRWLDRIRNVLTAKAWAAEWEDAVLAHRSLILLTREEATEAGRAIGEILEPYLDRRQDPSKRPAGAAPVEFTVFGYPREDLSGLLSGEPTPDEDTDQ
jgi:hypothetical protein